MAVLLLAAALTSALCSSDALMASAFQPTQVPTHAHVPLPLRTTATPTMLSASPVCADDGDARPMPSRASFLQRLVAASGALATINPTSAFAFDGGVGGLGKTKPETGIVFRNADLSTDASSGSGGGNDLTNELLAPDGSPALVSFDAPWPVLKSTSGVESRDLANPEAAFLQVAELPSPGKSAADLPKSFFIETVFGQRGKFGAYGVPTDIKVKKVSDSSTAAGTSLYAATFTALTPGGRESERQVFISAAVVGNGVFMLVTGTTAPRFKKQEDKLRLIAESFTCVVAPKSNLRSS